MLHKLHCRWRMVRKKHIYAVRSWGTEGRCAAAGHPQDEVPKNDHVYGYIVFRAADVVDLRIDDPSPNKTGGAAPESSVNKVSISIHVYT